MTSSAAPGAGAHEKRTGLHRKGGGAADNARGTDGGLATAPPPGLVYRPMREADIAFLAELYASTRRDELAPVPWSDERKEDFLRSQFEAQHRHYQEHFPDCAFLVIVRCSGEDGGGEPVGRLYVDRRDDEIRLVDIALLPGHRGRGLGTAILGRVLAEGRQRGLPVRIHVEHSNRARRLYERLGFHLLDTNGVYALMEWSP